MRDNRPIPHDVLREVIRKCWQDHGMQLYVKGCPATEGALRLAKYDESWPDMRPTVLETRYYPGLDRWGSQWTVEVEYTTVGHIAVYGVTPDGRIYLYAD